MPIPTFLTLGYTTAHVALFTMLVGISCFSSIVLRTSVDAVMRSAALPWANTGGAIARQAINKPTAVSCAGVWRTLITPSKIVLDISLSPFSLKRLWFGLFITSSVRLVWDA